MLTIIQQLCSKTKTHKIHTDKQIILRAVKWAQCDKTQSRELKELLI